MTKPRRVCHAWRQQRSKGFTLIELLVVLAIIAVLLTLSVPNYFHTIDRSRDAVLRENLKTTRDTIDKFYGDTGRYPDTLQELVDKRYLRTLPVDPVARSSNWSLIAPQDPDKGLIYDLKSTAPGTAADGTSYGEW
ncbi:type II secretion system protein [Burkholderia sp. PAMC 26561]|uniref:type II secretion system protein n=1 Tax=Burkholderia sp. PAMC 26561 TaxID=1795043 RepID=UPI00076B092E|nr:prepilin-type N-terminal cleavage/methylation domain-containing protein [Burkholderia sp. PAMC 26561]AME28736.1 type II secretion system protein G [Burkholderia sp. PAMC 26561]